MSKKDEKLRIISEGPMYDNNFITSRRTNL